jgi:hypothetical protein
MSFSCPNCNQVMRNQYKILLDCVACNIIYFLPCHLNNVAGETNKLYFNMKLIYEGEFEECCRAFKLRIFL